MLLFRFPCESCCSPDREGGDGGVFLGGEWVESIFNCTSPSTNLRFEKRLKGTTHTCPAAYCHLRILEALDNLPSILEFLVSHGGGGVSQSMVTSGSYS